jgi:hypothetical protein
MWLQIHGHIGIDLIVSKIILLHERIVQIDRPPLDDLDRVSLDLEGHRGLGWRASLPGDAFVVVAFVVVAVPVHLSEHP